MGVRNTTESEPWLCGLRKGRVPGLPPVFCTLLPWHNCYGLTACCQVSLLITMTYTDEAMCPACQWGHQATPVVAVVEWVRSGHCISASSLEKSWLKSTHWWGFFAKESFKRQEQKIVKLLWDPALITAVTVSVLCNLLSSLAEIWPWGLYQPLVSQLSEQCLCVVFIDWMHEWKTRVV